MARLIELLELPAGARILDVPCGHGRHTRLLAEAGYAAEGVDLSEPLLAEAKRLDPGGAKRYRHGDMRRLPASWRGRFDALVNLFTSFGFFLHPRDDSVVLAEFARVLRPGGVLVWHGGSRDGVMARFLSRDWWRTADGTMFGQERAFDPLAGVLHVHGSWHGPSGSGEREHRIRLYTATHLAELMAEHGLIVEQAFDGWNDRSLRRTSSEMVLLARKST